jgi:biopolymer transport protein ExbD
VTDVLIAESQIIDSIKTALEDVTKRSVLASVAGSEEQATDREVMIMGDRDIPYKLLKKIMASCTEAKYNNISLAVVKKTNMDG